jgi:hypothetical protein
LAGGKYVLKGHHIVVENEETGEKLDNVQSVTWCCAGREHEPVCVLVVKGVTIDVLADLSPEQEAALALLKDENERQANQ